AEHGDRPVTAGRKHLLEETHVRCAGNGGLDADGLGQRQPEYREAVSHTDTEVNGQCGRWNEPAVETALGDNALFRQERRLSD
nr:hypothetical protein [Tanacetum cinerariifolium]